MNLTKVICICISVLIALLLIPSANAVDVDLQDFIDFNIPNGHEELTIKNVPLVGDINLANVNKGDNSFEADLDLVLLGFGISGKIEYNDGFEVKCYFKLPSIFTNDQYDGDVKSEEFDLKIDHDGVHISGDITFINQIHLPPITLDNIHLVFDSDKKNFSGTVTIVSIEPLVGTFSGNITFADGKLSSLSLSGEDAGVINLEEIVGLTTVDGEIKNLDDLSNIEFDGSLDIGILKLIKFSDLRFVDIDASGKVQPVQKWFDISGDGKILSIPVTKTSVSFRPAFNLTVDSEVDFPIVLGAAYFQAQASLQVDKTDISGSASGSLKVPDSIPIIGGDTFSDVEASMSNDGLSGSVSINITPEIKEECVGGCSKHCSKYFGCTTVCVPKVCVIHHHDPITKSVGFTFDIGAGKISFNTSKPSAAYNQSPAWEVPYNQVITSSADGSSWQFMTNWVRLGKTTASQFLTSGFQTTPMGEPITIFTLGQGERSVIFRVTYSNDNVTFVDADLTLPSGTVLPVEAGPLPAGFDGIAGYGRFNPAAKEAYFFLDAPDAGDYTVTLSSSASLGEYSVELLAQVPEPSLDILSIQTTAAPGVWNVEYADEAYTEDAVVKLYVTEHLEENHTGFLIGAYDAANSSQTVQFNANATELPPGDYYVMMSINDGINPPVYVYNRDAIEIENANHPDPVAGVAVGSGNGSLNVEWTPSSDESITHYLIAWTERDLPGKWDHSKTVNSDVTQCTISGLRNGAPLLVSVMAINESGFASKAEDILRVVPRKTNSPAPPVITSTPDSDATAGYTYVYQPFFYDDDMESVSFFTDENAISDPEQFYSWELLEAPDGMEIYENGMIVWTPTEDQEGEHHCTLLLNDNTALDGNGYPATDVQEFTITVLPPYNTSGIESSPFVFITQPFLNAKQGETYEYYVQALAPDGEAVYSLLSAPDGMTISDDGLITWTPGENTDGAIVRVRADVMGSVSEQAFYLFVETEQNTLPPASSVNTKVFDAMK